MKICQRRKTVFQAAFITDYQKVAKLIFKQIKNIPNYINFKLTQFYLIKNLTGLIQPAAH